MGGLSNTGFTSSINAFLFLCLFTKFISASPLFKSETGYIIKPFKGIFLILISSLPSSTFT